VPREQDIAKIIAARNAKAAAEAAARRRASAGSEGPRFLARSQPPAPQPSRPSAPVVPQIAPQQIIQSPDIAIRTGQIQPTAPQFLSPGAAQAMRFQGITPSSIIPSVTINQPRTQGELTISRVSGAGLVIDPFGFSTTPERAEEALSGAAAGFAPRQVQPAIEQRPTTPATTGTTGAGPLRIDQVLLNLAAKTPRDFASAPSSST
jgi:hypothetical protein